MAEIRIRMPDGTIETIPVGKNFGSSGSAQHAVWALDYKTYGEASYVYNNREYYKELLSDFDIVMYDDMLRDIVLPNIQDDMGTVMAHVTKDDSFSAYSSWNEIINSQESFEKVLLSENASTVLLGSKVLWQQVLQNTTARGQLFDSLAVMKRAVEDGDFLKAVFDSNTYYSDVRNHSAAMEAIAGSSMAIDYLYNITNSNTIINTLYGAQVAKEAFVSSEVATNIILERQGYPLTYLLGQAATSIAENELWMTKLFSTEDNAILVTLNPTLSNAVYDSDMAVAKMVASAVTMNMIYKRTTTNYLAMYLVNTYNEQRLKSFETVVNSSNATAWFTDTTNNTSFSPQYYIAYGAANNQASRVAVANLIANSTESTIRKIFSYSPMINKFVNYSGYVWAELCTNVNVMQIAGTMNGIVSAVWQNQTAMANLAKAGKNSTVAFLSSPNSITYQQRKSTRYAANYYNTGLAGLLQYPANYVVQENIDVIAGAWYNANGASAMNAATVKSYVAELQGLMGAIVDVCGATGLTNFFANSMSVFVSSATMIHEAITTPSIRETMATTAIHNSLTSNSVTLATTLANNPDKFTKLTSININNNSNVYNYYMNADGVLTTTSNNGINRGEAQPIIVIASYLGSTSTSYTAYYGVGGNATTIYSQAGSAVSSPAKVLFGGMWGYTNYSSYPGRYTYVTADVYKAVV